MNHLKVKKIVKKIFKKFHLNNEHASISAEYLIKAELVGAPSHGLARLKMYCERIKKKIINPKPKIKVKKIKGFDGGGSLLMGHGSSANCGKQADG